MKLLTQLIPLASTCVVGSVLNANAGLTATLNFQDVTQGLLRFRDSTGTQIGSGSFKYSQAPVEGTFLFDPSGAYFFSDPSQIPEDILPIKTVSISADQDLRLVTNTNIDILGATFENQRADLSPGPFSGTALLFQPTQNTVFPPGPGGPFGVSAGGGRNPGIFFENRWFLGDIDPIQQQQLSMSSDGSFGGFDTSLVPSEELPSNGFSGKWEAEAVPEPFTVLGAASALGFGFYFKTKRKKQTSKVKQKVKA